MRPALPLSEHCTREKRNPYVRTPAASLSERPVSHRTYTSAFYRTTDSYSFQAYRPNTYRLFVGIDSIAQKRPNVTPHQNEPSKGSRPTSQGKVSKGRGREAPPFGRLGRRDSKGERGIETPLPFGRSFVPFWRVRKGPAGGSGMQSQQDKVSRRIRTISSSFRTNKLYMQIHIKSNLFFWNLLYFLLQSLYTHEPPTKRRS